MRIGRCNQHRELVAAHSCQHALFADDRIQAFGCFAQQHIAGLVAEQIVDFLEAIEVEIEHRHRLVRRMPDAAFPQ